MLWGWGRLKKSTLTEQASCLCTLVPCLSFTCRRFSVINLCPTFCDPMDCSKPCFPLSFTISRSLLKFTSVESMMIPNHLILCHPLLLLPSIFRSIRVFPNESALHIRWPKYWSFSPLNTGSS